MTRGAEETGKESHFDWNAVLRITFWNIAKYLFLSLRFYFTGRALGIEFPLLNSFFALPLVQISSLVGVTPAGLGIVEMGTYGALLLVEVPKSQILTFVVGQRVFISLTIVAMVGLNFLFDLVWSHGFRLKDS
jgi:uncharacterized membrane protein YbhN (UPF0104 family)